MLRLIKKILRNALRNSLRVCHVILRKDIEGQIIHYDPSTDIGWQLLVHGNFEQAEIEICKSLIDEHSTVIDIGANIGLHTISLAKKAIDGIVIAVEASPHTYCQLQRNTEGLSNVVKLNVALSSKCGLVDFFVSSDNAFSSLKDTRRKTVLSSIRVPCFSGEQVIKPILSSPVDLIKIDVEGLETDVIQGMRSIIEESRPVIFCEIYGGVSSNPDPLQTIATIINMNYRAYVLDDGVLRTYVEHSDAVYNYFFVPAEKLEAYHLFNKANCGSQI